MRACQCSGSRGAGDLVVRPSLCGIVCLDGDVSRDACYASYGDRSPSDATRRTDILVDFNALINDQRAQLVTSSEHNHKFDLYILKADAYDFSDTSRYTTTPLATRDVNVISHCSFFGYCLSRPCTVLKVGSQAQPPGVVHHPPFETPTANCLRTLLLHFLSYTSPF